LAIIALHVDVVVDVVVDVDLDVNLNLDLDATFDVNDPASMSMSTFRSKSPRGRGTRGPAGRCPRLAGRR
jgi:hypothetical protein